MKRLVLAAGLSCSLAVPASAQAPKDMIKEIFLIDTMDNFCELGIVHERTLDYIRENKLKATPNYIILVQQSISLAGEVQHTLEDAHEDASGVVCIQIRERARELKLLSK
ncbi:hypothetical protein SAMN05444141_101162 [Pseudovibrio denitrificans]|uniref:Uncharacterized protein n=1 Tax=Pseudovibrio denitrificans TaxID=258256 RepID=A0A1I6XFT0_9HYPH|nr:hypothetical protein [Pseudovibrio denitrificans]SFT37179.1 hypothetical protein SAMN05444141_101162 [Pseudovibrio denitrificans]